MVALDTFLTNLLILQYYVFSSILQITDILSKLSIDVAMCYKLLLQQRIIIDIRIHFAKPYFLTSVARSGENNLDIWEKLLN